MSQSVCNECGQTIPAGMNRCTGCGRNLAILSENKRTENESGPGFPSRWPVSIVMVVIVALVTGVVLTSMTAHDHRSHTETGEAVAGQPNQPLPDLTAETQRFESLGEKNKKMAFATAMADSMNQLGQPAVAATWLEKVWQIDSTDANLALKIANIWFDAGLKKMAVPYYRSFLARFPDQANARVDYATALMEAGDVMQAVTQLKQVLEINPTHQVANLNLGILNLQIGRPDQALTYFETARRADPASQAGIRAAEMKNLIKTQQINQ